MYDLGILCVECWDFPVLLNSILLYSLVNITVAILMVNIFGRVEQSSNLLLALVSTVILGYGPGWDPWLYFSSFQDLLCFEVGPALFRWEERSDYYTQQSPTFPSVLCLIRVKRCWPLAALSFLSLCPMGLMIILFCLNLRVMQIPHWCLWGILEILM